MSAILHERIVTLCDELKFQAVADVYADLADVAAKEEASYIEYLERVLKADAASTALKQVLDALPSEDFTPAPSATQPPAAPKISS